MDEVCSLNHHPCREAFRKNVYENARRCKQITRKKCAEDPSKKRICESTKYGISRFTKKQLCSYIVKNPLFTSEHHVKKKLFEEAGTLKKDFTETVLQPFFTPMKHTEYTDSGTIKDWAMFLYLAKYTKGTTALFSQQGMSKLYWTNWDENSEDPESMEEFQLFWPSQFDSFVRSARRRGIENIFVGMRMYKKIDNKTSKHANFLRIDLQHRKMYRYEPSGYGLSDVFEYDALDYELTEWARKRRLAYIPPWDSCPVQLFAKVAAQQRLAGRAAREAGDPGGFCKVWSTFMMEQSMRHPDIDLLTLQKNLTKMFLDNKIDMTAFGRMYIRRVNGIALDILRSHGMKSTVDPAEYFESHMKSIFKNL
jgi:hypothetical protein